MDITKLEKEKTIVLKDKKNNIIGRTTLSSIKDVFGNFFKDSKEITDEEYQYIIEFCKKKDFKLWELNWKIWYKELK